MTNEVARHASAIASLIDDALAWTADRENDPLIGDERKSIIQALHRDRRRVRKLARAARSKMCVSVFGPSQAGKSYLVSVLARPEGGRLVADYAGPDGQLDYISQINPEGEGESTGLVTRFTMTKLDTPEGFPIPIRLLGEADIVRTILNSFYMDGDRKEPAPDAAEIEAQLEACRGRAAAQSTGGMTEDEVWEIREYIEANFGDAAYAKSLAPFWEDAAEIAPRLDTTDRAGLFSILWARHTPLTELYETLAKARRTCGEGDLVFAPRSALVPREDSIIDVKTLQGLFGPDDRAPLPLQLESGKRIDMPRATICALASELVLPIRDKPSDLFDHTDLLDFPGARNRFKAPLAETLREAETTVPQLLLRGKVAYLFDRYVSYQEITSMLLCIPDSNMEAIDLPSLVANWIALTHGSTPEERNAGECILFFVLTKFDKHLIDVAGSDDNPTERFQRRLSASFEKFGPVSDSWPQKWTPDSSFQNCYWLRNPIFYAEAIIHYDRGREPWREMEIIPEKRARLEELGRGHNSAPLVMRHFADPAKAWDAALALNDGGVTHLLSRLAGVCHPETKTRQIAAQLEIVIRNILDRLVVHHVAEDHEQRLEDKMAAADQVIDAFDGILDKGRLGAFLGSMTVGVDDIAARIARVPDDVRIGSKPAGEDEASSRTEEDMSTGRPRPRPRPRPRLATSMAVRERSPSLAEDTRPKETRVMTREGFQAATAIQYWIETMRRIGDDAKTANRLGISRADANALIGELIHAAKRTGMKERIMAALKEVNYSLSARAQAVPAGLVCAEEINRFVETLGQKTVDEDMRPTTSLGDGNTRPVFRQEPVRFSAAGLPAIPVNHAEDYRDDWVFALHDMFRQNALHGDDGSLNVEQNIRLGRILAGLRERQAL
ncbi:MAG: virulence factor SrfC family protein [Paracoccaceae bacterium]|nr:virulence factor SrfC family protein [Paracoccaceae bacterium]